jgi:hypothetical protein
MVSSPKAPLGSELIAPDDLEALAVHADALIERGSVLGEVIAAQLGIHKLGPDGDPEKRTRLAMESRQLLAVHHVELFGSLAPHALSVVPRSEREPTGQFAACTASWRLGVIDEVALAASSKMALADTIPALAKVPAARHLRSIVCGSSSPPSARFAPVAYDRFLVALVDHAPAFPRLRSLFLGNLGDGVVAENVGSLAALYEAFPGLEILRIRANVVKLGSFPLPALRELELVGDCASIATLRRLQKAMLQELVSVVADPIVGRDSFEEALDCVSLLPRLERLALPGWDGTEKIASLLRFPRLAQLKELDLSHSGLITEIQALVDNADRFTHLERLDLRFNDFTANPRLFPVLRERLPRANTAGQTVTRYRAERYERIEE